MRLPYFPPRQWSFRLLILRRASGAFANGTTFEEEDEGNRRNHNSNKREEQAGILEAHVVEHLRNPQRNSGTDTRTHKRLRGNGGGRVIGVRIHNERISRDVDNQHAEPEKDTRSGWANPDDALVRGECENEERDGHEDAADHHEV